jgi:hypothetical protein
MPQQILLKRSATAAKVPLVADLALGEVAINTTDGKMFIRKNNGADSIVEIGAQVFTGDVTGSGNGNIAMTLADSGVTSGAYGSSTLIPVVTVDSKGRVTALTTQALGNAPTATKLATARTISSSGDATWSVSFDGSANATAALTLAATGVAAGTYTKITVDAKGRATLGALLASSDVTTALGFTPQNLAHKDTANGYAGLDATGKIASSQLPAIAITDTFVVATQAAMLALTAEVGDVAVRTDLNKSFILKTDGASTLANWQELLTPTDTVTSVAGRIGAVTLAQADIAGLTTTSSPTFSAVTATTFTGALSGNATTATTSTHNSGGVAGAIRYQTGVGASGYSAAGTTGQILISGGTGAPTWVNQNAIVLQSSQVTTALGYTPLNKAGDTMTGALTLSGAPTAALHAATKAYVDSAITSGTTVMDGGSF